MNEPNIVELLVKADSFLDSEAQHKANNQLGQKLFEVFGSDQQGRVSTQVRNLERIAMSASRFADIEDFVKNQMGKEKLDERKGLGPWRRIGDEILGHLKQLREQASQLTQSPHLTPIEPVRLMLRLRLARGWVRGVVGSYLYAKAMKEMEHEHA